ncbi:hypothetical protein B0H10DRAFT_2329445 [Mycena sp. CBHHK59/15]|nr:hypothetical protein B0H10DRAFT_2329445 [Mycena sp. CBHHK59/15]
MVIPSGEKSQPENPAASPNSSDAPSDSKLLFSDDIAAKNSFRAHDNSIPSAVFSLAKNGLSPPLTLFLPASLERIRSSNVKTVKHGTGETTKVAVIDVSDFPDEDNLDQANWCTTYNTFLTFLESAVGPRIFESFAHHYNRMLTDPELATWFRAYRSFDKKIRAQFFTTPYIIDVNDTEYRSALQLAKDSFFMSTRALSASSAAKGGPTAPPKDKAERYKPYDKDSASHRRPILCFRCGRVSHGAATCEETNPSRHGREFVIYANRNGLFRIRDKHPVCLRFNWSRCDSTAPCHPFTSAPSVATLTTERQTVLATEHAKVVTPYHAAGWYTALRDSNLLNDTLILCMTSLMALLLATLPFLPLPLYHLICLQPTSIPPLLMITSPARSPLVG